MREEEVWQIGVELDSVHAFELDTVLGRRSLCCYQCLMKELLLLTGLYL